MNRQILKLMIRAATQSAQIILENFRQDSHVSAKSSHLDIMTQTDLASQQAIHDCLVKGMVELGFKKEDVGFIQEESNRDHLHKHNFIVDPIDGTTNFASGLPHSCISIAYAHDKEVKLGVVLEPFTHTLFYAEKNNGSFKLIAGKKALLKLQPKSAKKWLVAGHYNALDVVADQFITYQKIYPAVRGLRNWGSLTLDVCFMADDIYDLILCNGCYIWDLAAAQVILHEAGGEIYQADGSALKFNWSETKKKYHILASHPKNKPRVMSLIND